LDFNCKFLYLEYCNYCDLGKSLETIRCNKLYQPPQSSLLVQPINWFQEMQWQFDQIQMFLTLLIIVSNDWCPQHNNDNFLYHNMYLSYSWQTFTYQQVWNCLLRSMSPIMALPFTQPSALITTIPVTPILGWVSTGTSLTANPASHPRPKAPEYQNILQFPHWHQASAPPWSLLYHPDKNTTASISVSMHACMPGINISTTSLLISAYSPIGQY